MLSKNLSVRHGGCSLIGRRSPDKDFEKRESGRPQVVYQKEVSRMESGESRKAECCATALQSDVELASRVRVFLAGLRLPGLRGIAVDIDSGVATVSGTANSFHEKQLATHCCQRVAGVVSVVNEIDVEPRAARTPSPTERRHAR
jgi:osmotically-inducible protein OsmY